MILHGCSIDIRDFKLLMRNTFISNLILESDGDIDMKTVLTFTNDEIAEQIAFIRALKQFEGLDC